MNYKYLLYPTREQVEILERTLDYCGELYSAALAERRDAYEIGVRRHPNYYDDEIRKVLVSARAVSYNEQCAELPSIQEIRPEYKDIHLQVLQDVLWRVDKATRACFKRAKNGVGYPRFPSHYDSFTFPEVSNYALGVGGNKLVLPHIGQIYIDMGYEVINNIKRATIKREGEHRYAVFVCQ